MDEDSGVRYFIGSQSNISVPEAMELVANTRKNVLILFPGKEETYDLIYKPRFERIIKEYLSNN